MILFRFSGSQHGQPGERIPGSCCLSDSLESMSFDEDISKLFAIFCLRRQSFADSFIVELIESFGAVVFKITDDPFESCLKSSIRKSLLLVAVAVLFQFIISMCSLYNVFYFVRPNVFSPPNVSRLDAALRKTKLPPPDIVPLTIVPVAT